MVVRPSPLRVALLAAVTFLPFPAARADDGDAGRKYAVLVGVSEYRSSAELRNLEGTGNDVTALRDVLLGGGYRAEDITLLTSQGGGRLKPTGQNIRTAIKEAVGRCKPEDTLVLAFAGHGLQFEGNPEPFFCPYDAVWNKTDTLVPLLQVFEEAGRCPAKRKLLLVDACRVDPLAESTGREQNAKAISKGFSLALPSGGDVVALLSCSKSQVSWEDRRLKHGVFFHFVIRGLAGEAAEKDGTVTLDGLAKYVKPAVVEHVKKEFDADQEPYQLGQGGVFPVLRLTSATEAAGLMRDGLLAESKGDPAAALAAYNKALDLDKKNAEAYYRRGLLEMKAAKAAETDKKNEKYHEAARDFTKALKYKPDYIAAYLRRADANYYLNSLDAALQDYEEALETDGQAVEVLVDRGFVFLGLEQPKKAIADLDKAIELNPENARAYYVRGAAKIDDKQVDDGLKDLDKAIEMDPLNVSFREYRLAVAVKQGDAARVQQDETRLEQVAAYVPASDVATQERIYNQRANVGTFYQSSGNTDRAEKVFERAAREA
ncbi:MAG: trypsin-like serine protease with C-terminal domain, partial [Gemmataceae bacterium]|nr:trypsin-like serine protease with C-terminal domain [Gemmataceae bacterium]